MQDGAVFIVNIRVQSRSGYLYAASPELPGLHVCGATEEGLHASLVLAIKTLFKRNRALDVQVRPVAESLDTFPMDGARPERLAVLRC